MELKQDVFRHEKILNTIITYITEHGYCPSIRELCQLTGIKSTATIQKYINEMLENGLLETDCGIGTPRALRIPGYKFVKA